MNNFMSRFSIALLASAALTLAGCGGQEASGSSSGGGAPTGDSTSQSGSTAAMLPYKNALYTLTGNQLKTFDITPGVPTVLVKESPAPGAETLFVYEGYLYIGGRSGVEIWNLDRPHSPRRTSNYPHVRSCDPVIVDQGVGYVTLRNRTGCGGDVNRLEIVDFSDPQNPREISRYDMAFPYGLAKTDEYLAVCQEAFGLTLLDVNITDKDSPTGVTVSEVANFNDINCFDLIYRDKVLLFTATDGIYQMAVNGFWLTELSVIPVGDES